MMARCAFILFIWTALSTVTAIDYHQEGTDLTPYLRQEGGFYSPEAPKSATIGVALNQKPEGENGSRVSFQLVTNVHKTLNLSGSCPHHRRRHHHCRDEDLKQTRRHRRVGTHHHHHHHRHFSQELQKDKEIEKVPFFDKSSPSFVTAQLGSNAFLSCRIHHLQDKSVSWIRNRDAHILTVDRYTFISDSRFVSWFDSGLETWTLQVKFVSSEDAGRYECQVSTEPKRSHFVTLAVIAPKVEIPGGSELHVRSGSDVLLKCIVSRTLTSPPHVFWYHKERQLETSVGGVVHQAPLQRVSKDSSVASFRIQGAQQSHAGNYTCAPAGITSTASVLLHVLNGEHPAAMQHGSNDGSRHESQIIYVYFLIVSSVSLFKVIYLCGSS